MRLVREARERAEGASEAQCRADEPGKLPVVSVHWAQFYAEDVPALCDALEEANERIRELEEQVRTYMEFPYTVPKQR